MPKNARCFGTDIMKGEGGGMKKYMGSKVKPDGAGHLSCSVWAKEKGIKSKVVKLEEAESGAGTSVFDPVLCELVYRWFSPKEAYIIDPFAGGSVRGIVASVLGRNYTGVDLSSNQIEANIKQVETICKDHIPIYHNADSLNIKEVAKGEYDLLFTCPPYANLEIYSDDPRDISNMDYPEFYKTFRQIIFNSLSILKEDRFAVIVVGEVRDKKGKYFNFVSDTIKICCEAGLIYYNEAILITVAGSLPIRAGKAFTASRKLGKTHQNVLVFVKGDPKKATEACGEVEITDFEDLQDNNPL
jgi:DNA modification methylase